MNENGPSQPSLKIEQIERISTEDFWKGFVRPQKPVVIKAMMEDWPAMQKWSFEYLAGLSTDEKVLLEFGNVMQQQTEFKEIEFSDHVRRIMDKDNAEEDGQISYLSVFDIFKILPELKKDVDFSLLSERTIKDFIFGWIGPKGTVTGYHCDWADNLLAQICGSKELRLVSSEQSHCMYPSRKFDIGSTLSRVETDPLDKDRFPLFEQAREYHTELHPGEMLFTPRGWWHQVRSLVKSISVNNFGLGIKGLIIDGGREKMKEFLHNIGLYARTDCTCHMMKDGKRIKRRF
jgi:ribosomal protein L16 Arg81 hydroxylase